LLHPLPLKNYPAREFFVAGKPPSNEKFPNRAKLASSSNFCANFQLHTGDENSSNYRFSFWDRSNFFRGGGFNYKEEKYIFIVSQRRILIKLRT